MATANRRYDSGYPNINALVDIPPIPCWDCLHNEWGVSFRNRKILLEIPVGSPLLPKAHDNTALIAICTEILNRLMEPARNTQLIYLTRLEISFHTSSIHIVWSSVTDFSNLHPRPKPRPIYISSQQGKWLAKLELKE
jgi:hypothetical protein